MSPAAIDLVHTLSQNRVSEVPLRFIQPPVQRPSPILLDEEGRIPVIDLARLQEGDGRSISEEIARACEEWGFFQVVNHGIPVSLLEKAKKVIKGFLDLPMEVKQNLPMKFEPYHPTGYGRLFDFSPDTILDWVDALIHYLAPPNLKDQDYWPASPADYRESIEAYGKEIQKLIRIILEILSCNLGLSPHYLENAIGGETAQFVLRVNHYPRCPQADLVMGLSPHSDGSAITVLLQDEVEGLQVLKDGRWCTVQPIPGALIVNMGDMMQLISNGKFMSVEHRAVVHKDKDRMSIVVFYAPAVDAVISPSAPADGEPPLPLYRSIRYGDYLDFYMNNELKGKARIDALRIQPS